MTRPRAGGPAAPGLQALYEDAPCGLLITAADGLVQRANRTFCRWVGRDAADLVDQVRFQDLLSMGGRIFMQTHWMPLLQIQGSVSEVKLEVLCPDGRKLPMVLNAVRYEDDGVVRHELALFVAEDRHKYERELIAARQRAEELLAEGQHTQRALTDAQAERDRQQRMAEDRALFAEQMIAIVSHDLRNPLSVIRMSSHLIGMGELSSNQLRALERLTSSNARASRLITDLLDFSQARLGKGLNVTLKPIELHALVAESVADLQLAFPASALVHRQQGDGPCRASADRLIQLIGNLVANAVAHGAPDRPVQVVSTVAHDTFSIAVHNEGAPIDQELLPRLFEPMTRGVEEAGPATSVGLGLYIVREIARAHGGAVSVVSTAPGGTTFEATLPRAPA